jgi:hypothetical protein
LSHGSVSGDIPAISVGAKRLAQGIATALYQDDLASHYTALQNYAEPELDGDEWQPADVVTDAHGNVIATGGMAGAAADGAVHSLGHSGTP